MSFEPDTSDIAIRQLREEIAKIREEQFVRALPTNNVTSGSGINAESGIASPSIGIASIIPALIRITKDTGVIDKLDYDGLITDFVLGEVITGGSSGATATIGDIDLTTSTTGTLILVPSSITGTFTDDENITGSIAGDADVDGTLFTQTGRGHLNAGAGSIIASAEDISSPFEIHFIDNAQQDGQIIYVRAQDGQTIRVRRALTTDSTTGNVDLDESFDIVENALVFFQYQVASNASTTGGWVPLITGVSVGTGGVGGGGISFPILYPKENLGTLNGVINLALNQSDGHYKQVTLDGDASITFSNLPPSINGFKFYLLTNQDGVGGHVYTDLPNSVLFEASLLSQLQTAPNAQTLWQFSTADGGTNWHASVIQSQGSVAGQTPWLSDINANTFNLFNLDVLRYADGTQPGADGIIGFGEWGSAVDNDSILKWSIPASTLGNSRGYEWQVDLAPVMKLNIDQFGNSGLDMIFKGTIDNTKGISFFHTVGTLSSITPGAVELRYENGIISGGGGFHGFHVGGEINPQFEIREDVIRANRNLDMITNNIFDVDVVEWASTGGFLAGTNHGIRSIGGGSTGLEYNVPNGKTHRIMFENIGLTDSDVQYEFDENNMFFNNNQIKDILGITFTNGLFMADILTEFQVIGGRQNPNIPDTQPQPIKFRAQEKTGFDTYVTRDIFTIDAEEFFGGGGMKMHTDLNLQTQNINNVDVLKFIPDGGVIVGTEYAIGANPSDLGLNFNVPQTRDYTFNNNANPIAVLDPTGLQLLASAEELSTSLNPQMGAREFALTGVHTTGITGMLDGSFRLVDNAGSLDVMVGTGTSVINLSNLGAGGTSFIGFNADDDLRMNTFNITNLDVLRFQVDGGVIGFGEYGITADPFSMRFSVPSGLGYSFEDNLDPVAFINKDGLQLLANTGNSDPNFIAKEYVVIDHSQGTLGLTNGAWRKVGDDVIVRSGDTNVNLTTLSAGGADNLGDHIATQPLELRGNNLQLNLTGETILSSPASGIALLDLDGDFITFGQASFDIADKLMVFGEISTPSNATSNTGRLYVKGVGTHAELFYKDELGTETNIITGGGGVQLGDSPTWTGSHNFNGASMIIGDSSSDTVAFNSLVLSSILPQSSGLNLGSSTNRWDLFGEGLNLQLGVGVNDISNSLTAFGSTQLMTANAIQNAILAFGGGGGISDSDNVTWTGNHTFNGGNVFINSPAITIGNQTTDVVSITARVSGSFIPLASGQQLGQSGNRWEVDAQGLQLQFGQRVTNISTSSGQSSSTALMTASAIQSAIASGGGGISSGDSVNWTGNHTFNGSQVFINSPAITIGDQNTDQVAITARVSQNIIPTSDGINLGDTSRRWDLFAEDLDLQFGATVNNISTSSTQSSSTALMTASAIQSAISAGGGVSLSDNNLWQNFNSWNFQATFNSSILVQGTANLSGTLNHDGSRVGFYGTTPQTRSSGWFVSGGPDDRTLFVNSASTLEVAEVLGTLIRQLERIGLII